MSQKAKRNSTALDDKDKSRSDTPVKDMKKKTAANVEKEKAAAEKSEQGKAATEQNKAAAAQNKNVVEHSKTTTVVIKTTMETSKTAAVQGKAAVEQSKTAAVQVKVTTEQSKTAAIQGKAAAEQSKTSASQGKAAAEVTKTAATEQGKTGTPATPQGQDKVKEIPLPAEKKDDAKADKAEKAKAAPESAAAAAAARQNGDGARAAPNGDTVSAPDDADDESFPELAYDEASDDGDAPGRSATRRDQVKPTRTPETPRPASHRIGNGDDKMADESAPAADSPKPETKLLKLREEYSASPMRLRSSDRSTPDPAAAAAPASASTPVAAAADQPADGGVDDTNELKPEDESVSKKDTNFSKSRIKISPYRRSSRLQDSMLANYTGNNTTMEMDITESFSEQPAGASSSEPATDGGYMHGLRRIRGRRSYKPHAEMSLHSVITRPTKHTRDVDVVTRPTVHVVGRKRKPLDEDDIGDRTVEAAEEATEAAGGKRMRLLERVVTPFASLVRRRTVASSTPLPVRRSQPIVGINTDLPLHAPVGALEGALGGGLPPTDPLLHPESLKPSEVPAEAAHADKSNRCLLM